MDIAAQEELVARYDNAAAKISDSRLQISPLLIEAATLLNEPTPDIRSTLWLVEKHLRNDSQDVHWRGDMLVEADRQMAHKIGTTIGGLINPNLAERAILHGWSYKEAELRAELAALRSLSTGEQIQRRSRIRELEIDIEQIDAERINSAPDSGGSLTTRRRARFSSLPGTSREAGLSTIVEALDHTADPTRVANDEFEIVYLDNGKVMLVLPGVADLTETITAVGETVLGSGGYEQTVGVVGVVNGVGWNMQHHSVRDAWIAGRKSTASASVADNLYAQLVRNYINDAIVRGDFEGGSDVMIVGHSYGADTAVDLAADPIFNGQLVNVTHVVAAAYHSEPQLEHVPGATKVAVVQNLKDLVILAEAELDGDAVTQGQLQALGGRLVVNAAVAGVNLATEAVVEVGEGVAEVAANTAKEVTNATVTTGEPVIYSDFEFDAPDIPSVGAAVHVFEVDNIVLAEFDGGFEGVGHHQNNYTDYLKETTDPAMSEFFEDVAKSGYTGGGLAWAVDVTVPEEMR